MPILEINWNSASLITYRLSSQTFMIEIGGTSEMVE